ncbi:MAG: ATP-grasp domain-containing protein [Candidatus Aminicenantes bacterium]|nr:ATP-grasp domain-containing protein [Candidatus Aminicenantes bacterium]
MPKNSISKRFSRFSFRHYLENILVNDTNIEQLFLLEEFIEGDEYSVEGICTKEEVLVIGICQKRGLHIENGIRSEGVNFSPILDKSREIFLKDMAKSAVKAVGMMNTAFHIELRWDKNKNKPRVIEINPRLPGGLLCRLHKEINRIDLPELLIKISLGEDLPKGVPEPLQGVFGDLPIPCFKSGVYNGYKLPENNEYSYMINDAEIDIVEFTQKGTILNIGDKEVYYAHAFIHAPNHKVLFDAANWSMNVSPIFI